MSLDQVEDEELAQPRRMWWLNLLLPAAVALVVVLVLFKHSPDTSTHTPSQSATTPVLPDAISIPATLPSELRTCPRVALCTQVDTVPDETIAALRSVVVGARTHTITNIQVVRPDILSSTVWYRKIDAGTELVRIQVWVTQPVKTDKNVQRVTFGTDDVINDVVLTTVDRTVHVQTIAPRNMSPTITQLSALARDVRLVLPQ